jgi:recombination protein RecA
MGKFESIQALAAISPSASRPDLPAAVPSRAPLWEQWGAGQILELSGKAPGKLSTVARLLLRAQAEGEPCAWVSPRDESSFYPPDFAQAGIDLAALVVVRVPPEAGSHGVVRASELLLRSGAFGLLVVDFSYGVPRGELSWQSRLSGLLRSHDARIVLLTKTEAHEPSLGPMVGLRLEPQVSAHSASRVSLGQRVLKCKLGAALSISPDIRVPPLGAVRHA